ncbi:amino acid permease [Nocardia sp. NBC_00565]|uniref:amino acid permease n=1 Tax=Nocardia sp. NBC_00565 TaxID=2975993 RepID=UPI002E8002E2|nr:amino acid permease [Nocardia sp. NBC_00565]WUC07555.1 amino acid permease [Nocardia sp. NBC_00565]
MSASPVAAADLPSEQDAADAAQLAALGYRQRLTRALGLWSNFAVGFTYLSPLVGIYSVFNYGLTQGGPSFFWTIPLVLLGQGLVLLVFAEVASQYPIAGGIYQWAKRLVGPRYAWLSGWMYTWALLITVSSVAYPIATYAGPLFGYSVTHTSTVATAVIVILACAAINLLGVRRLAFVANIGVAAEVLGTVGLGLYLLCFHHKHDVTVVLHNYGAGGSAGYLGAFLASCLFAVWIFYGFEACGDIAEEVKDPSRKVPRAMGLTLGVGAIATVVLTLGLIVAVPDFGAVISGDSADPLGEVLDDALGGVGSKVALALIVVGFVSCTLAIQAAATRLVYSFGRDGVIFGAKKLSTLHPTFHMPPGAIAVTAIIPAAIAFLPSATVTRIITFAVVGIYIGFQSVVLAAIIGRARGWKPSGVFRLGAFAWPVNIAALVYGVTAIVVLSVKTPATGTSFFDHWMVPTSVAVIAVVGLSYLLIMRPKERVQEEDRAA